MKLKKSAIESFMFGAVVYVRRQTVVGKKPLKLDISIARAFHKASLLKQVETNLDYFHPLILHYEYWVVTSQ